MLDVVRLLSREDNFISAGNELVVRERGILHEFEGLEQWESVIFTAGLSLETMFMYLLLRI